MIILVDDLDKEWISNYGSEDISTQHIDALTKSEISFNMAYSLMQFKPKIITLFTRQNPFRPGWLNRWEVPCW
jgi:hypothetical protein